MSAMSSDCGMDCLLTVSTSTLWTMSSLQFFSFSKMTVRTFATTVIPALSGVRGLCYLIRHIAHFGYARQLRESLWDTADVCVCVMRKLLLLVKWNVFSLWMHGELCIKRWNLVLKTMHSHCILQQMEHTCTLWLDGSVLFILLLRACVAEWFMREYRWWCSAALRWDKLQLHIVEAAYSRLWCAAIRPRCATAQKPVCKLHWCSVYTCLSSRLLDQLLLNIVVFVYTSNRSHDLIK